MSEWIERLEDKKFFIKFANSCDEVELYDAIAELIRRSNRFDRSISFRQLADDLSDAGIKIFEKRFGEWVPF